MRKNYEVIRKVQQLSDGSRTSVEIAAILGMKPRYVRKVQLKNGLQRPNRGAQPGDRNHQFVSGLRIDRDGYVVITADPDHPYARQRPNRNGKIILLHRHLMEQELGRYLLPGEVVDHIDGLRLHNHIDNLRLFESNGQHLACTLKGNTPNWSKRGLARLKSNNRQLSESQPVDTHDLRTKRGDVRLQQILLALLKFGKDSPYLLGTSHHLKKAGIDLSSRSTIQLALDRLNRKYA